MAWPTFPIQGSRLVSAFRGDFNDIINSLVSMFVSPTAPTSTFACMLWADTGEGTLKQRNSSNTGWNVVKLLNQDYGGMLPLAGGTMTGPINMGSQAITNLPAGSGASPARYSDLVAYMKVDGSVAFTGIPSLPASNPISDNQAVRKKYVDDAIHAGGTYTGQIIMQVAPSVANHVMRKTDVDTLVANHTHTGAVDKGPKIGASGISSQGQPGNYVLVATGTNGAAWILCPADQIQFPGDGSETIIASITSSGSWQTANIAGFITDDCVAVCVRCTKDLGATWPTVKFRSYNRTGTGISYYGLANGATPYHYITIPVISGWIEFTATKSDGSGPLNLVMSHYIRRGAYSGGS